MTLGSREMDKLANLWDFHRKDCQHRGEMKIEFASGGGIGTRVLAFCGCGKEMDITNYHDW